MRELKFRIMYKKYTNDWLKNEYALRDLIEMDGNGFLNDDDIIEQFTGLHDKNGKEIYEGDIVRYWDKNYEVKFDDIEDSDITYYYLGWAMGELSLCESASMCEVIGNIHENPELLN